MNPTSDELENRVAAMEGGIGALALASGSAATTYAIMTICEAGDNIVVLGHYMVALIHYSHINCLDLELKLNLESTIKLMIWLN